MKMKTKFDNGFVKGPLMGIGIAIVIMLLLAAICAWMVDGGKMELDALPTAVNGILFLSALAGAAFTGRGEKGLLKGGICGAGILLLLVCINALMLSGTYGGFLSGAIATAIASFLPGILNKLPKKGNVKRRRKKRNR